MDADSLFGLPLDQFVSERTALARSLRAEGRRDEAAEVAASRKPSVAAWAVNQLVRTQASAIAELFDAGDALRDTQEQVLEGRGDGRSLRAAAERERLAVEELVKTARGLLSSEGHGLSDVVVARIDDTLHAAALDEDAREHVRTGRLVRELRHVGFGAGLGAGGGEPAPAPSRPRRGAQAKPKPKPKPTTRSEPDPGARERLEQERREHERAERERTAAATAARITESETRRAAERAARAVKVAEDRRERAAQSLAKADEELAAARAEAEARAGAHEEAADTLQRLAS